MPLMRTWIMPGGWPVLWWKLEDQTLKKDSKEYVKTNGRLKTGQCAVTRPGNLPCKCLLHAVGPVWFIEAANRCDDELSECIRNVLKYVNQHTDIKSVAIPAVSSGIFGFPLQRCADIMVKTIHLFFLTVTQTHLKEIRLVNNNDPAVQAMKAACENIFGPSDDLSGATSASSSQTRPVTRSMTATSQPSPTTSSYRSALMQPSAHGSPMEMSQPITINGLTLHLKRGLIEEQKVSPSHVSSRPSPRIMSTAIYTITQESFPGVSALLYPEKKNLNLPFSLECPGWA
ncbi:unnamed protein product [Staurois parvus]|uniref:Macro domain-containing protein n=1 Tax=Staurois parvus TaxID=386267 RepID=A0ABN9DA92_9NEOB|nr:unnamed protein product [Staurois parvus]